MLKKFIAATVNRLRGEAVSAVEFPLETEARLNALHARAPVDHHLDVLFDGFNIGGEPYTRLYQRCLAETATPVTPFNVFHRFQSRRDLLQYFFATLDIPGARAECGAYRGATALLLAHAWHSRQPDFDGDGLYLIDSFVGTSASGPQDLIPVRDGVDLRREAFFPVAQAGLTPELGLCSSRRHAVCTNAGSAGIFLSASEQRRRDRVRRLTILPRCARRLG